MTTEVPSSAVLCWGELLWDEFPDGRTPGGAPLNVAVNLVRCGIPAAVVSSVGNDESGGELLKVAKRCGVSTDLIRVVEKIPTGRVRVAIDAEGVPCFKIDPDSAWDRIFPDLATFRAAADAPAVIFGSLAQRKPGNAAALSTFLDSARGLKIMDVNLRYPFFDIDEVRRVSRRADAIKVNESELSVLIPETGSWGTADATDDDTSGLSERLFRGAMELCRFTGAGTVAVTAGSRGAGLLSSGTWNFRKAGHVAVVDTVGAGDAFTAGLAAGLIESMNPARIIELACGLAENSTRHAGAFVIDGQPG